MFFFTILIFCFKTSVIFWITFVICLSIDLKVQNSWIVFDGKEINCFSKNIYAFCQGFTRLFCWRRYRFLMVIKRYDRVFLILFLHAGNPITVNNETIFIEFFNTYRRSHTKVVISIRIFRTPEIRSHFKTINYCYYERHATRFLSRTS